jgi:hypothetical protein
MAADQAATCRQSAAAIAVISRTIGTSPGFRSISIDRALALVRESIYPVREFQQAILCVRHTRLRCHAAISFGLHS